MANVKVIYGSSTGNTESAAAVIAGAFGTEAINITNAKPEDFDYEIRTGMGSITVGGQDYSGMDREKIVEYGSDRKMKLDSSMGSIEILWESR